MKNVVRTLESKTFNHLRQGTTLYQKNKVFYIKIQDLDTGVFTPIHNASKKLYKNLVKVYDELDAKISAQQAFDYDFGKRNIPPLDEVKTDEIQ